MTPPFNGFQKQTCTWVSENVQCTYTMVMSFEVCINISINTVQFRRELVLLPLRCRALKCVSRRNVVLIRDLVGNPILSLSKERQGMTSKTRSTLHSGRIPRTFGSLRCLFMTPSTHRKVARRNRDPTCYDMT